MMPTGVRNAVCEGHVAESHLGQEQPSVVQESEAVAAKAIAKNQGAASPAG